MVANRGFVVALGLLVCSQASAQPHHRKHKKLDRLAPAKEPEPQGQVELVALAPEIELDPAPPMPPLLQDEVVQVAAPAPTSSWQFELGPYVWASNVDVNIDLGILSAGTNIGFVQLVQHARYGIEGLGELRNGHVSFAGDVVYGAASVS